LRFGGRKRRGAYVRAGKREKRESVGEYINQNDGPFYLKIGHLVANLTNLS